MHFKIMVLKGTPASASRPKGVPFPEGLFGYTWTMEALLYFE